MKQKVLNDGAILILNGKRHQCYSEAAFQFSILYSLVEHKLATICNSIPDEQSQQKLKYMKNDHLDDRLTSVIESEN